MQNSFCFCQLLIFPNVMKMMSLKLPILKLKMCEIKQLRLKSHRSTPKIDAATREKILFFKETKSLKNAIFSV